MSHSPSYCTLRWSQVQARCCCCHPALQHPSSSSSCSRRSRCVNDETPQRQKPACYLGPPTPPPGTCWWDIPVWRIILLFSTQKERSLIFSFYFSFPLYLYLSPSLVPSFFHSRHAYFSLFVRGGNSGNAGRRKCDHKSVLLVHLHNTMH